jgi:hypothetical protein
MTKSISNTSNEILGINPSELTGYSVEEISDMIRSVQAGTQDGNMTEEEVYATAEQIYKYAN